MSLRHAILGIIEFQPVHGYQIRQILREGISTFWPVNLNAIYPALKRLEEEGLVGHRTEATGQGRPDRKVYEITDRGRQEMAAWRRLPPEGEPSTRSPLFLKLLFARTEDLPTTIDWIGKEIEAARGRADQLRSDLHDPDAFDTLFVRSMRESGLAHLELQIELLQELRARVQALLPPPGEGASREAP